MNEKNGFTLIELLGFLVLMGMLFIYSSRTITNLVDDSREVAFRTRETSFEKAAENHVLISLKGILPFVGGVYTLPIDDIDQSFVENVTSLSIEACIGNINVYENDEKPFTYDAIIKCGDSESGSYSDTNDPVIVLNGLNPVSANRNYTASLLHFNNETMTDTVKLNNWQVMGDTYINSFEKVLGKRSISFDGAGDFIDTFDSNLSDVTTNYEIDFLVKRETFLNNQYVFGQTDNSLTASNTGIYAYFDSSNHFNVGIGHSSSLCSTPTIGTISDTAWHHIAISKQGLNLSIYIDGTLDTSDTLCGTVNNSSNNFAIGRAGEYNTDYFNGSIDEFRIVTTHPNFTSDFTPNIEEYSIAFPEPFAVATDDVDGDISEKITTNIDLDLTTAGTFIINYSVRDGALNYSAPVSRTVNIVNW